jgi:8-oxo-dGTP pyrophosphatase MutT (NUDIX family)
LYFSCSIVRLHLERSTAMRVIYANQTPPKSWTSSIFLAGPTPRENRDIPAPPSWRPDALRVLEMLRYNGVVFVPETEDGVMKHDYDDQIEWEEMCLNFADKILFWIPRELVTMPGFTTNDEWGYWKKCDPRKLVLGAPEGTPKVKYQRYYAEKLDIPFSERFAECVLRCLMTNNDVRTCGERHVPLHVWRTPAFQNWYKLQRLAGNTLNSARVAWVHNVIEELPPFFSILHVDVTTKDGERKDNEVIICRPDTSVVILYRKGALPLETKIVFIEEFRSPVANASGKVLTLPGGSSMNPQLFPAGVACEECYEEVGLHISPDKFIDHSARQLDAATLTHRAHLFSYELSEDELVNIMSDADKPLGVSEMQEVTRRKVLTLEEALARPDIDWSVKGMLSEVFLCSPL